MMKLALTKLFKDLLVFKLYWFCIYLLMIDIKYNEGLQDLSKFITDICISSINTQYIYMAR
jgi:hypothetical protein